MRRVRKVIKRTHAGQTYVVRDPTASCGGRVYDGAAMGQIEASAPACQKMRGAAPS
jgi:hypothetical protein